MVLSIIGTPVARMAREKPIEMDDEDWGSSICGNPHMAFFFFCRLDDEDWTFLWEIHWEIQVNGRSRVLETFRIKRDPRLCS